MRAPVQAWCGHMSLAQLRWCCHAPHRASALPQPVTLREAIGSLESY